MANCACQEQLNAARLERDDAEKKYFEMGKRVEKASKELEGLRKICLNAAHFIFIAY